MSYDQLFERKELERQQDEEKWNELEREFWCKKNREKQEDYKLNE